MPVKARSTAAVAVTTPMRLATQESGVLAFLRPRACAVSGGSSGRCLALLHAFYSLRERIRKESPGCTITFPIARSNAS